MMVDADVGNMAGTAAAAAAAAAADRQQTAKAMYPRSSPLHTPMWVTLLVAAFGEYGGAVRSRAAASCR